MARHLWTSVDCFIFNCYSHWLPTLLQNRYGTANVIHIWDGINQGGGDWIWLPNALDSFL